VELPVPEAKEGEILVKVRACGVCHTELDEIEGRTPPPRLPVVLGHEVVGLVAARGPGARRFREGDRVGVGWIHSSCGGDQENLSDQFRATGRDAFGGYAEFTTVPADYAYPIPTTVITELLGLPAEDYPLLREFSTLAPPASEEDFEPTARILEQAMGYFAVKFEEKQRNPGDDLTTALVQAEIDGDRLDESNRFAMVMLLLVAGYTTTAHLIGNATLALLQHPDQLELLKRDPSLIESAVEELLRYDGPMETALMRWATEDVEMRGQTIRRGDLSFEGAISDDALEAGTRSYLFGAGRFALGRGYELNFDIELVSAPSYLLEYDYSGKDRLESAVSINRPN